MIRKKRKAIGLPNQGQEREENDFYATHPSAVEPLLKLLNWENGGKLIWENSCGQGHLTLPLQDHGHKVVSTDLIDRGFGIHGVDFLKPNVFETIPFDAVIMNPPYKHALDFVKKSLIVAPVVCAFLRINFLESEGRYRWFQENPPKIVAVFSYRIKSSKSAEFKKGESSATLFAWFIWEQGFKGDPVIKWIAPLPK